MVYKLSFSRTEKILTKPFTSVVACQIATTVPGGSFKTSVYMMVVVPWESVLEQEKQRNERCCRSVYWTPEEHLDDNPSSSLCCRLSS